MCFYDMNAYLFRNFDRHWQLLDTGATDFDIQAFINQNAADKNVELLKFYEEFFKNDDFDEEKY